MYEPRKYRDLMADGRFRPSHVAVGETDLWIGLDRSVMAEETKNKLAGFIKSLRKEIKDYIFQFPLFYESHTPVPVLEDDPESIKLMKEAGILAGTGPMAAIAGLVAMRSLEYLESFYPKDEIIIENGGDIYLKIREEMVLNPLPVSNRHFKDLAIKIPAADPYLSVCSSSGQFGHSFSYGEADLVTAFSKDACIADTWATAIANKVRNKEDIERLCRDLPEGLKAILLIKDDRLGYRGPYKFV